MISQEDYDKMTPTARSRFQALPGNLSEDGGGQQYYIRMPGAEPSTTAARPPTQAQAAPTENAVTALNNIRPLPVTEPAPSNLVNNRGVPEPSMPVLTPVIPASLYPGPARPTSRTVQPGSIPQPTRATPVVHSCDCGNH